jgi:hypothetical protein
MVSPDEDGPIGLVGRIQGVEVDSVKASFDAWKEPLAPIASRRHARTLVG